MYDDYTHTAFSSIPVGDLRSPDILSKLVWKFRLCILLFLLFFVLFFCFLVSSIPDVGLELLSPRELRVPLTEPAKRPRMLSFYCNFHTKIKILHLLQIDLKVERSTSIPLIGCRSLKKKINRNTKNYLHLALDSECRETEQCFSNPLLSRTQWLCF